MRLRWAHELALGARLAVTSRGGLARVVLTALGLGLGVAVLLLTVSLVTADNERKLREDARITVTEPNGEPARLLLRFGGTQFRDRYIRGDVLDAIGPNPPLPPGIDRLPEDGEVFVSPALAELLASPDGELLRPRIPWRVAGTIGKEGLVDPWDLLYYAGESLSPADEGVSAAYGYGGRPRQSAPIINVLFGLAGGVLLLVPVFVLIGAATRIAAAARERRLAALRLVGADANQTRRIASGEALVGSVAGLLLGAVVFVVGARFAERVRLLGFGVFADDLRPPVLGLLLIAVVVPALAVLSGVVALRHAIGSPLGVTRQAKPPRRQLRWRIAPLVVGVALLVPQAGAFTAGTVGLFAALSVLAGMLLVGISVPLLLPWLLQRAVDPLAGGPPSWQLAVRRIQLDSGTPARAAAGVAAILTGVVALQGMLAAPFANPPGTPRSDTVEVSSTRASIDDLRLAGLADIEGVREVAVYNAIFGNAGQGSGAVQLIVADCATLRQLARIDGCADGDVFVTGQGVRLGEELTFRAWDGEQAVDIGRWTVPADAPAVELKPNGFDPQYIVLVTQAARPAVAADMFVTRALWTIDTGHPDAIEHIRNAMVRVDPTAAAYTNDSGASGVIEIRNGLLVGALIVLLLAAASLLIVSIEQVRERRQQLAALAAAGVPARTLAASVLWQAVVPFMVAAVSALAIGVGLAALTLRVFGFPFSIDWSIVGAIVAASALAVLVVAGLTMPFLRSAIRPESLRTE